LCERQLTALQEQHEEENVHTGKELDVRSDIHNVGLITFSLMNNHFIKLDPPDKAPNKRSWKSKPTPPAGSKHLYTTRLTDLASRCVNLDPASRPNLSKLLDETDEGLQDYLNYFGNAGGFHKMDDAFPDDCDPFAQGKPWPKKRTSESNGVGQSKRSRREPAVAEPAAAREGIPAGSAGPAGPVGAGGSRNAKPPPWGAAHASGVEEKGPEVSAPPFEPSMTPSRKKSPGGLPTPDTHEGTRSASFRERSDQVRRSNVIKPPTPKIERSVRAGEGDSGPDEAEDGDEEKKSTVDGEDKARDDIPFADKEKKSTVGTEDKAREKDPSANKSERRTRIRSHRSEGAESERRTESTSSLPRKRGRSYAKERVQE
jgi:serine/threonine protein kinase